MVHSIHVKSISKLSSHIHAEEKLYNRWSDYVDISYIFWYKILSNIFLSSFFKNYLFFIKDSLSSHDYSLTKDKLNFILSNIETAKKNVDFKTSTLCPTWNDVFFSYKLFSEIVSYINHFYKNDGIHIKLDSGILFQREINSIESIIENIKFYQKTNFFIELIEPIIINIFEQQDDIVYIFDIFWPNEFILVWIIWEILKKRNKRIIIVVDFSNANEQFDFSQWTDILIKSPEIFIYYDYFIIDRDFWTWLKQIQQYLDWYLEKSKIQNVIFKQEDTIIYNKIKNSDLPDDMFIQFMHSTFTDKNIWKLMNKKHIAARLLPYKCYWNQCSFCAINSNNKFIYNKNYSYDFFVDQWIAYIQKYNIESINFLDEAILPRVIILFAKKLVQLNLYVNYQFRTRFDRLYTYENCKILKKSWCSFCWIWLESAVERVNQEIGNKWNFWITLADKLKIIHSFDQAWVSFHNYSIMWFPWESLTESAITYKFLKNNIIHSNYYTCTPNIFCLMKWPKIFNEQEKYWVEIDKNKLENPFSLVYEFTYHEKKINYTLLYKFVGDLHKTQFLPWLLDNNQINSISFWEYIDRSWIFYIMKKYYTSNPFYIYKNINNAILEKKIEEICNTKFKLSSYIQISESDDHIKLYLYDWVWCKNTIFSTRYRKFITCYDQNISLKENLRALEYNLDKQTEELIYVLLRDRILMKL